MILGGLFILTLASIGVNVAVFNSMLTFIENLGAVIVNVPQITLSSLLNNLYISVYIQY